MKPIYLTVSTKGQVVIPSDLRKELGIGPGTRLALRAEGSRLVLDPETVTAKLRRIDEMMGLTSGGPSMCDALLEERRLERERELTEEGW